MSELRFDGVSVSYDGCPAVIEVTETIASGEWLCLIGPNGAGKSSLLRACLGLIPYHGSILVDGVALSTLSFSSRARLIAYAPQEPLLPDTMCAYEYVLLGRTPYVSRFGRESGEDRRIALEVLDRLDLGVFAKRPLGSLSGGERQRIVIARALAQQCPILLLDEPTSSLDVGHQQQALELVDRLRLESKLTVFSTMHDLTLAGLYCDRLALIRLGRFVATGPAVEVLRADLLSETYDAAVRILRDPDGTVVVVPTRKGLRV